MAIDSDSIEVHYTYDNINSYGTTEEQSSYFTIHISDIQNFEDLLGGGLESLLAASSDSDYGTYTNNDGNTGYYGTANNLSEYIGEFIWASDARYGECSFGSSIHYYYGSADDLKEHYPDVFCDSSAVPAEPVAPFTWHDCTFREMTNEEAMEALATGQFPEFVYVQSGKFGIFDNDIYGYNIANANVYNVAASQLSIYSDSICDGWSITASDDYIIIDTHDVSCIEFKLTGTDIDNISNLATLYGVIDCRPSCWNMCGEVQAWYDADASECFGTIQSIPRGDVLIVLYINYLSWPSDVCLTITSIRAHTGDES